MNYIAFAMFIAGPFLVPLVVGGIWGHVIKSWTPVITFTLIGLVLEILWYLVILRNFTVQ